MKKELVFRLVLALGIFFLVYQFGLKPLFGDIAADKKGKQETALYQSDSSGNTYDVVVLGEEPDGIAAAVMSARLGARTLLLAGHDNLGGIVSRCLLTDMELPYGADNKLLNAAFLSELNFKLGRKFSPADYEKTVSDIVKNEKNLDVIYNAELESIDTRGYKLERLNIIAEGTKSTVGAGVFIDATRDGQLLAACNVKFITGSADLNLKDSYLPLKLNFEMTGADDTGISGLKKTAAASLYKKLSEYEPMDADIRIGDFYIHETGNNTINVQGLEIAGVDVMDTLKIKRAYNTAVKEAKNLALFLSHSFSELKGWTFKRPADELYIGEDRHFKGLFVLGVNDILENKYFNKTIAMGSYPVNIGKFAGKSAIFAGKPVQYGIPVGCLITPEVDNLLMTGAKISYSSLASSSAGTLGTSTATGSAAGAVAVWCLMNGLQPAEMERDVSPENAGAFNGFLSKQGFFLPEKEFKNKYADSWAYPALRELLALGLVAGGADNDYRLDRQASQADLAILLLNGIYRLDSNKYTLELDRRLRSRFNSEALTSQTASEILAALYDLPDAEGNLFGKVSSLGYIDEVMQLELKDKKLLTMEDVFYLAAHNIKMFTGKVPSE